MGGGKFTKNGLQLVRGTESLLLEAKCKVFTISDGSGCHVICCFTVFSEVNAAVSQGVLEHFMLPAADLLTNFMEMQISFSNRTWHLHTAESTGTWFEDHGIPVFN